MIFRPELVKFIRNGQKTQTRRAVKAGEPTCRYEPGKAYAVQPGRGHVQVCRITVIEVHRETITDISIKDARREGFRTRNQFHSYWLSLYAPGWEQSDDETDEQLGERINGWPGWRRIALTPVWVISFELGDSTDRPRLLVSGAGRERFKAAPGRKPGSKRQVVADTEASQDYVSQPHLAMAGEPEAVTEHEQRQQTERARKADAARLADPDIQLRLKLAKALEEWELKTGGVASTAEAFRSIKAIREQLKTLDRRLKAA